MNVDEPVPASMWTSFHAALIGGRRWEEFDRMYGPMIRAWAERTGLQPPDAADIAQDVFVKLINQEKGLISYDKERGGFRAWLSGVVRNAALDLFRSRARRPGDGGMGGTDHQIGLDQFAAEQLASELSEFAASRLSRLEELEARCSPRDWALATSFHVTGSARAASEMHRVSVGAVHQAVYRVRKEAQLLGISGPN